MVHLTHFANVVAQHGRLQLVRAERGLGLVQRPGKVVAIVFQRNIRVLRGVKTAVLLVSKPLVHPVNHVPRHKSKKLVAGKLVSVNVVLQQLGIVVRHLFKVRHNPVFIH